MDGTFQTVDLFKLWGTTSAEVPYLEGSILKFQDDGGRFCAGETSVIIDPDNKHLITQTKKIQTV